jgi:curved DNA-binding protein CbpA
MAKEANYYERLGLRSNASVQDIRRAYRDLSKLYHPDTTELESAIAIPKFQALNEAYATLSSPEKRLSYDYKTGFSRLSVMQSFAQNERSANNGSTHSSEPEAGPQPYAANAYLSPTDRPLSAGELFALFILGITFVACLLLVLMLGLTKGDVTLDGPLDSPLEGSLDNSLGDRNELSQPNVSQPNVLQPNALQPDALQPNSAHLAPELPQAPWLVPKSFSRPSSQPSISPVSPAIPSR